MCLFQLSTTQNSEIFFTYQKPNKSYIKENYDKLGQKSGKIITCSSFVTMTIGIDAARWLKNQSAAL